MIRDAVVQVLEGKLALKTGAEGGSVDVNMQQLQVMRRAGGGGDGGDDDDDDDDDDDGDDDDGDDDDRLN